MQEGNKTVFAVSGTRRIKDNQGGLQAITRKNPVYAGYTVETHHYLSANRSQTAS
jgi:hypothetical protein